MDTNNTARLSDEQRAETEQEHPEAVKLRQQFVSRLIGFKNDEWAVEDVLSAMRRCVSLAKDHALEVADKEFESQRTEFCAMLAIDDAPEETLHEAVLEHQRCLTGWIKRAGEAEAWQRKALLVLVEARDDYCSEDAHNWDCPYRREKGGPTCDCGAFKTQAAMDELIASAPVPPTAPEPQGDETETPRLPTQTEPTSFAPGMVRPNPACWCEQCNPDAWWMITCPDCGNKRCPRANKHEHDCTKSNALGQKGSSWEHVAPWEERVPATLTPTSEPGPVLPEGWRWSNNDGIEYRSEVLFDSHGKLRANCEFSSRICGYVLYDPVGPFVKAESLEAAQRAALTAALALDGEGGAE